ncbi:uncharacterized protein LOC142348638 isoform X2 [Convolutriloba macropyga]|uniref:uncharacterized protein LOC142348638 isoform X2 n=1 Tax=Convolutriloba macropyga TaxID=536237 RepID=UPI003F51D1CD
MIFKDVIAFIFCLMLRKISFNDGYIVPEDTIAAELRYGVSMTDLPVCAAARLSRSFGLTTRSCAEKAAWNFTSIRYYCLRPTGERSYRRRQFGQYIPYPPDFNVVHRDDDLALLMFKESDYENECNFTGIEICPDENQQGVYQAYDNPHAKLSLIFSKHELKLSSKCVHKSAKLLCFENDMRWQIQSQKAEGSPVVKIVKNSNGTTSHCLMVQNNKMTGIVLEVKGNDLYAINVQNKDIHKWITDMIAGRDIEADENPITTATMTTTDEPMPSEKPDFGNEINKKVILILLTSLLIIFVLLLYIIIVLVMCCTFRKAKTHVN